MVLIFKYHFSRLCENVWTVAVVTRSATN